MSEQKIVKNYDGLWALPVTALVVGLCFMAIKGCEQRAIQRMEYIKQGYVEVAEDRFVPASVEKQARPTP